MSNKPNQYSTGPLVFNYNSTGQCLKPDREIYSKKIGADNKGLDFEIQFKNDHPHVALELLLFEGGEIRNFSDFFQNLGEARSIKLSRAIPSVKLKFKEQLLVGGKEPLHINQNKLELNFWHNIPACSHTDTDALRMTHVDLHVEC